MIEEAALDGFAKPLEPSRGDDFFRILVENATDVVTLLDANGVIRYESPSVMTVLGYAPQALIGRNAFELIHPDDTAVIRAIFDRAVRAPRSRGTGEFRFRHADGSWRTLEGVGRNLLDDPRVAGVVVSSRDVTARRGAEDALRRSNEALTTLIEASPFAITAIGPDWHVLHWNAAAEQLFGWAPVEVIGRALPTIPPARREEHRTVCEHVLRGITVTAVETQRQCRSGALIDVTLSAAPLRSPDGVPYAVLAMFVDDTARKRSEMRESAAERRFRAVFEHAGDAAILMTLEAYVDCNPMTLRLFGCTREELLAATPGAFSPPRQRDGTDSLPLAGSRIADALAGRPQRFDWVCARKDGTQIDVEVSVSRLEGEERALALVVLRDTTDRRRAAKELEETNRRLRDALAGLRAAEQHASQQERLRALGTMASGIAHDFNNALTCILGFTELMLAAPERIPDIPTTLRYLEFIRTSARDAGSVVKRLRDFYRHRDAADLFVDVDLDRTVQDAIALTEPRWRAEAEARGVPFAIVPELEPLPPVGGDPAELREALANLLFNAVDAMPTGGTIRVRTRVEPQHVVLEVVDTGTGMTEEVRRRCLDPFFTTKGDAGTGLGLSIVYGVVQRHGGTLSIQSELGVGSTFTVRLPRRATLTLPGPPGPAERGAFGRPLRVLLVDDQERVRDVIAAFLAMDGHQVRAAGNGVEALGALAQGAFDLVIADRAMPEMGGDALALRVKERWPTLPVLMLTGFGSMMEASGERPPGIDALVSKPVTIQTLRSAIASVVRSA